MHDISTMDEALKNIFEKKKVTQLTKFTGASIHNTALAKYANSTVKSSHFLNKTYSSVFKGKVFNASSLGAAERLRYKLFSELNGCQIEDLQNLYKVDLDVFQYDPLKYISW